MTKNISSILAILVSLSAANAYSGPIPRMVSSFILNRINGGVPSRFYSSKPTEKEKLKLFFPELTDSFMELQNLDIEMFFNNHFYKLKIEELYSVALMNKDKDKIYHLVDQYPNFYKGNKKLIKELLDYADEARDGFLRFHVERAFKKDECSAVSFTPLKFSSPDELRTNLKDAIAVNDSFRVSKILMFNVLELKKDQLGDEILYYAVDSNQFPLAFLALKYLDANPNSMHERRLENGIPSIITPYLLALELKNDEISKLLLGYLEAKKQ